MKRAVLAAALLLAAGCGGSEEKWGGATEKQAREVLEDPNVRAQLDAIEVKYPTDQQIEDAELRRVTLRGQEAWEFEHPIERYCLYVYEDPATESFTAQHSACVAD